ncbi:craniofacial development protein 2-like [Zophobas morio]|uniref:craniofacial development protein 2-like n=1 Tax=Zophobas morio TaxID=2755281 RepID=UPI003083BDF0
MTTYAKLMDDPIEITKRKKNPKIRIGTWNVRGTYSEGKLKQIVQELQSGIDNRELGTGFMVKKSLKGAVITFKPISERISYIRLRKYYEELEREYVKIPKHDIKMVIGDANAMIGKENCYRPTIGKESKHQKTNQNGEKLIEFAEENKMVVKSTFFAQKEIYKGTWMSPDGKTVNQTDHILVERRDAQLITRLRSYRGAEANSDHFLVRSDLKQEIPKKKEGKKTQRDINDVKKEKRGYQPRVIYCKDKDGNLIGDEQARIKRWAEYFEELPNEQDTQQDTNERVNDSVDPDETIEIDEGEIRETLR